VRPPSESQLSTLVAQQEDLLDRLRDKYLVSRGLLMEQESISNELKERQVSIKRILAQGPDTSQNNRQSRCLSRGGQAADAENETQVVALNIPAAPAASLGRKLHRGVVVISSDVSDDTSEHVSEIHPGTAPAKPSLVMSPKMHPSPMPSEGISDMWTNQTGSSHWSGSRGDRQASQYRELLGLPQGSPRTHDQAIAERNAERLSRRIAGSILSKGKSVLQAWVQGADDDDEDYANFRMPRPSHVTTPSGLRRSGSHLDEPPARPDAQSPSEQTRPSDSSGVEALATRDERYTHRRFSRTLQRAGSFMFRTRTEDGGESSKDTNYMNDTNGFLKVSAKKYRGFSEFEQEQQHKARKVNEERKLRRLRSNNHLLSQASYWEAKSAMLKSAIQSTYFETFWGTVLLTNCAMIGVQVQYKAMERTDNQPAEFDTLDYVYAALFVLELSLRMWAESIRGFFISKDWNWNLFDFVVVSLTVLETAATIIVQDGSVKNVAVLRVVRIMRVARVLRVIRVMRFFRALRILITAISGTVKNFVWTVLLLMIINYTFGVVFTQAGVDYEVEHGRDAYLETDMNAKYRNLQTSVLTLFQASTGGIDWKEAILPLQELDQPHYVFFFLVFISFVYLAVLNVVTGLFCQSAIEMAQSDHQDLVQTMLAEKQRFVKSLCRLFREWDTSKDGEITLAEFEEHLQDEKMVAFLKALEIDIEDSWTLFKLLDQDRGGTVTVNEFVEGCLRLKGNAKSMQVHQMMYESRFAQERIVKCLLDNERILLQVKHDHSKLNAKWESRFETWQTEMAELRKEVSEAAEDKELQDSQLVVSEVGAGTEHALPPIFPRGGRYKMPPGIEV